ESRKLAKELGIDDILVYAGYLAHSRSVEWLRRADVLWMTVGRQEGAETISTSKLFEYFGSRKPILGLLPEGAARSALQRYRAAEIVDPNGIPEIAAAIERLYEKWVSKSLPAPPEDVVIQFDRVRLTKHLAKVLETSISETTQHSKAVSSALS
ncbi:MAG: glycosyl transferase family 1, partial [Rhodothermales bacterium]